MSLTSSSQQSFPSTMALSFDLKCKKHTDEDIFMVNLDKAYNKEYSRLICMNCNTEIAQEEKYKVVNIVGLKHILRYEQKEIQSLQEEPVLEGRLPLDKEKKKNCMDIISRYQNTNTEKTNYVQNIFSQFKDQARAKIDEAKKLGLEYYKRLKDSGNNLTSQYEQIVDCCEFKKIVNESKTESELNKRTALFIQSKFQVKQNNETLDKANKDFNDIHSEYTLDFFNRYNKEAETLANMITFNSEKQEAQKKGLQQMSSQSQLSSSSNRSVKGNQGNFLREFFDSESSSPYTITHYSDSSESLSLPQGSNQNYPILKAVSATQLDPKGHYQAIFKIEILNLKEFSNSENNFILLGLTKSIQGDIPLSDQNLGLFIQNKKSNQGCSIVKYGNDLSFPTSTSVISMNICISKNIFYFSDSNKVSSNILPTQPNFEARTPLSLFIASRGNVKITLVSIQAKQQK